MRIALLGPANSIHLQRWAHALVGRGHAVCVLSQHGCERELLPTAADVFMLPRGGSLGYFTNAWRVRDLLQTWRPDVLNAHYASGYGTTAALCAVRPLLLSVWGSDVYDFPYESAFKARLIRSNLRRATALASTSHAMARQARRLTPERREIAVTPFGVELARFVPDPSRRAPGAVTIGIVKTLAPKYGVDLLLRAFAGLVADADVKRLLREELRLLVVGDGPQRAELEALAHQLGIAARTQFAGAVAHADVPAWLNRLDIYAAPSRLDSESFGVAVVEASACALPVVVSDVGGLPEVVRDFETGLIVPRDDVPTLQAALKSLVLDAALRERLGQRGRAHVASEYEWGHCVDLMERCLERVARTGAAR
jgi:glycosyltransferase involved in cell wall biosynthesis